LGRSVINPAFERTRRGMVRGQFSLLGATSASKRRKDSKGRHGHTARRNVSDERTPSTRALPGPICVTLERVSLKSQGSQKGSLQVRQRKFKRYEHGTAFNQGLSRLIPPWKEGQRGDTIGFVWRTSCPRKSFAKCCRIHRLAFSSLGSRYKGGRPRKAVRAGHLPGRALKKGWVRKTLAGDQEMISAKLLSGGLLHPEEGSYNTKGLSFTHFAVTFCMEVREKGSSIYNCGGLGSCRLS